MIKTRNTNRKDHKGWNLTSDILRFRFNSSIKVSNSSFAEYNIYNKAPIVRKLSVDLFVEDSTIQNGQASNLCFIPERLGLGFGCNSERSDLQREKVKSPIIISRKLEREYKNRKFSNYNRKVRRKRAERLHKRVIYNKEPRVWRIMNRWIFRSDINRWINNWFCYIFWSNFVKVLLFWTSKCISELPLCPCGVPC